MEAAAKSNSPCTHGNLPTTSSSNVSINGNGALRKTDLYGGHGTVFGGSTTVFINGQKAARQGDSIIGNCGSVIATGSGNVNIG